uniref:cysteine dioxygenase n=1 Tax=Oryza sativa subsp. japonica TaxID=39947 RepID=Q2QPN9_ORYSJ|nr:hypothetical protein LOC_Os12g33820 [Oryza sativa Japonica Group]
MPLTSICQDVESGTASQQHMSRTAYVIIYRTRFLSCFRIQIQICIKGIHGFKLISYAPGMDQSEHHHRLAVVAADWSLRLYGWLVTPPLLGVYVFTDRLAFVAADWCLRLHGWPLCRRCWASTSSPTGRLVRRRLVFPPARLAFMPPLLGIYVFTDRPPCPPPTGVSACTAGLYVAVVGRLRLHRSAASSAADWCFRLHDWPIMPPLLGVYVFTDRLAFAVVDWCLRLHGWPIMPPLLGVYVFTDRLAFAVVDWCLRLHGWPIMPPLLGVYVFTDRLALVRRRLVFPPARLACYDTN